MPASLAAIVLILVGACLDVPIAIVLGIVTLLIEVVRDAWARRGLRDVRYAAASARAASPFGRARSRSTIEVWNRERLPAGLAAGRRRGEPRRRRSAERDLGTATSPGPGPAQRLDPRAVRAGRPPLPRRGRPARRVHARARRAVGRRPVRPRAPPSRVRAETDTLPRPAADHPDDRARAARSLGRPRPGARSGLAEDPSRFAGVRPYAPGDPLRRIHRPRERPARRAAGRSASSRRATARC